MQQISNAIFALQKERGYTFGLSERATGETLSQLNQYRNDSNTALSDIAIQSAQNQNLLSSLPSTAELMSLRALFDQRLLTREQAMTLYTAKIDALLDLFLAIELKIAADAVNSHLYSLTRAIEQAGKLRAHTYAMLNNTLDNRASAIFELSTLHNTHLALLTNTPFSESIVKQITALQTQPQNQTLNDVLLLLERTGHSTFNAQQWWQQKTQYIELLITIVSTQLTAHQQQLSTELKAHDSTKLDYALYAVIAFVGIVLASTLLWRTLGYSKKPKRHQTPVKLSQLLLLLGLIVSFIMSEHDISQGELSNGLYTRSANELSNNLAYSVIAIDNLWLKPLAERLHTLSITKQPVFSNATGTEYIGKFTLSDNDLVGLFPATLPVQKLQKTITDSITRQGPQSLSLALMSDSNNKLYSVSTAPQASANGLSDILLVLIQPIDDTLTKILKMPVAYQGITTHLLFNDIVIGRNDYSTGQAAMLPKNGLELIHQNFALGFTVRATQDPEQIEGYINTLQQEFSVQLALLLTLSLTALVLAHRAQNRIIEQLQHSEAQLDKERLLLSNSEQIVGMGSWEWQQGSRDVLLSKTLKNLMSVKSSGKYVPYTEVLRKLTHSSRRVLFNHLRTQTLDSQIRLTLSFCDEQESEKQLEVIMTSHQSDASDSLCVVGVVRDISEQVAQQQRQGKYQASLQAARQEALDRMKEAETQRHEVQQLLHRNRETESLLEATLDSIPAFILLLDGDANIRLINRFWYKSKRLNLEESGLFINTLMRVNDNLIDVISLLPLSNKKPLLEALASAKTRDLYYKDMEICYQLDGAKMWFEVILTNIMCNDKKYMLLYQHDITQRKNDATTLADAKETAEAANKAKSRFLATMSHEIRTPMNGVVGMLDILSQSRLSDEQRHLTSVAKNSAMMLLRIINDILDFSKIEAGKMVIEHAAFSWQNLTKELCELMSHQCHEKRINLNFYFDPALGYWHKSDPIRIRQILLNLVGNAVKFTKTSASKTGNVEVFVSPATESGYLEISVKDNGKGMSEAQTQGLFKPFVQADDSIQRKYGGTGLGLSITMRLCELMNGTIVCHSLEDVGSNFIVTLPFAPSETGEQEIAISFEGLTAYIVSDDDKFEQDLAHNLSAHGMHCQLISDDDLNAYLLARLNVDYLIITSEKYQHLVTNGQDIISTNSELKCLVLEHTNIQMPAIEGANIYALENNPYYAFRVIEKIATLEGQISPEPDMSQLASEEQLPTIEQAQQKNALILVIEDNVYNQDLFKRQLALLGLQCIIAEHGAIALELMQKYRFSLIISDCHMPVMDGYTFAKTYRELETQGKVPSLPIIAATANALSGEREKCLTAGMDDYICKPIVLHALRAKIEQWLHRPQTSGLPVLNGHATGLVSTVVNQPEAALSDAQAKVSEPEKSSTRIVDLNVLENYVGSDKAIQKQFLQGFLADSRPLVEGLSAKEVSLSTIKNTAHQLKSSAKAIGAQTLADEFFALEQAAKAADVIKVQALQKACDDKFNAACVEIETILE
nr:ATP-binding protein [Pseudoalteromonas sp. OOF1S-7]